MESQHRATTAGAFLSTLGIEFSSQLLIEYLSITIADGVRLVEADGEEPIVLDLKRHDSTPFSLAPTARRCVRRDALPVWGAGGERLRNCAGVR